MGNNSQFVQPGFHQPQQPQFFSPAGGQPAAQPSYPGMQQQQQPQQQQGGMPGPAPYMDGSQNLYGQAQAQQQQQPYGQQGVNQMNQQFGQMGLGGQKPVCLALNGLSGVDEDCLVPASDYQPDKSAFEPCRASITSAGD